MARVSNIKHSFSGEESRSCVLDLMRAKGWCYSIALQLSFVFHCHGCLVFNLDY